MKIRPNPLAKDYNMDVPSEPLKTKKEMKLVRSKQPCPKCGNKDFELGEAYIAGSVVTKLFNIQNRKFSSFTCTKCKYTEFYQIPASKVLNVLDFFVG